MTHPSIIVKSNWGMDKSKAITQLVTGNAGFKILETRRNSNFHRSYQTGESVGLLFNNTHGYRLGRFKPLSGEAPSVAELANLLSNISRSAKDVKVRGSPLEYKRLLDYFQFLLVSKVTGNGELYLTRPNNVNLLDAVNERNVSLEEAYMTLFDGELSNRTMYNTAYFVTGDRPAAMASVIRRVPTLFQESKGQKLHLIPEGDNSRIRKYLVEKLTDRSLGYTVSGMGMLSLGEENIIYKMDKIEWYLDTEKLFDRRLVSSNDVRALILFYWIFSYPGRSNIPVVEAFFAIVDTFHDFKPSDRSGGKGGNGNGGSLFGTQNNRERFKARKVNTINLNNVSNTKTAHKTLVRLLGTDIYRKVSSGYGNSLKSIVKGVNGRTELKPDVKVGRFLYFVTSLFGSDSGSLIKACEELSRDILIAIASNNSPLYNRGLHSNAPTNPLCQRLDSESACLVIDMMFGSLPDCLAKYSVFHNVGVLDPASKRILSWGEIPNGVGCIETGDDIKRRKRRVKEARLRVKKLKNTKMQAAAKERRKEKAAETRIQRRQEELNQKRRESNERQRKQQEAAQRRAASTRGAPAPAPAPAPVKSPFKMNKSPSNMKMNISKKSPPKSATRRTPLPPNPFRLAQRRISAAQNSPRPPRSVRDALTPIPETRAESAARSRRNAPASAGTRSASRRTPSTTR